MKPRKAFVAVVIGLSAAGLCHAQGTITFGNAIFTGGNNIGIQAGNNGTASVSNQNGANSVSVNNAGTTISGPTVSNGITNAGNVGTTTLSTTGNSTIGGNQNVAGALGVAGQTNTNGIVNLGNITSGSLRVSGNTTVGSTLDVNDNFAMRAGTAPGAVSRFTLSPALTTLNGPTGASSLAIGAGTATLTGNGARAQFSGTDASLLNSTGHGIAVSGQRTVISGGSSSTTLTLDDTGATFANTLTANGPARVTGVANGTQQFDAVNFGQLDALEGRLSDRLDITDAAVSAQGVRIGTLEQRADQTDRRIDGLARAAYQGIAMASALASAPAVDGSGAISFGVANYRDATAFGVNMQQKFWSNRAGAGIGAGWADGSQNAIVRAAVSFGW